MKKWIIIALLIVASQLFAQEVVWNGPAVDFSHGRLKISDNKRFLVFDDGTPFFYLGDTAWELFHRLTPEQVEKYLENRRQKGFTVIQAVVLAELDGLNVPNALGEKPLFDNDPLRPNEKYFDHVDWVIDKAREKGLFIGLLPTWGDKVERAQWGVGPVIFNPDIAEKYAAWLAKRYQDRPNIIWINGGDRDGGGNNQPIWNAIGQGIKKTDKNHLLTFHPGGGKSSSQWFHKTDWLDFNMSQTGHCERSYSIYKTLTAQDYNRQPIKPCFDGEPRYEDHPVCWNPNVLGWFDDVDVRQAAYWSLFTGSFGHTYGCHAIWQFLSEGRQPIGYARNSWEADMDLPGAWDMIHVRKLLESRDFLSRTPAPELLSDPYYPEHAYRVATRGKDYALIYLPDGNATEINLDAIHAEKLKAWWYNPRTGVAQYIENLQARGRQKFTPPTMNRGNDWVLVLDDERANYPAPGQ